MLSWMRFRNGFGEGKVVKDHGELRNGSDCIIPNDQLLNLGQEEILERWNRFQPVVEELQRYDEEALQLSVYDDLRDREFETAVFDGNTLLALKTEIEGFPQYFPTPYFFQRLKENDRSIVRFKDSPEPRFFSVEIDTRDRDFDIRDPEMNFNTETFKHKYQKRDTLTTDFVTSVDGLTGISRQGHSDVIAGLTTSYQPLNEYIQEEFHQGSSPFEIQTVEAYFYQGDTVVAGARTHTDYGREIFLTKQGYQFFINQGLAIVRAERDEEQSRWTDLEVLIHPEMEVEP